MSRVSAVVLLAAVLAATLVLAMPVDTDRRLAADDDAQAVDDAAAFTEVHATARVAAETAAGVALLNAHAATLGQAVVERVGARRAVVAARAAAAAQFNGYEHLFVGDAAWADARKAAILTQAPSQQVMADLHPGVFALAGDARPHAARVDELKAGAAAAADAVRRGAGDGAPVPSIPAFGPGRSVLPAAASASAAAAASAPSEVKRVDDDEVITFDWEADMDAVAADAPADGRADPALAAAYEAKHGRTATTGGGSAGLTAAGLPFTGLLERRASLSRKLRRVRRTAQPRFQQMEVVVKGAQGMEVVMEDDSERRVVEADAVGAELDVVNGGQTSNGGAGTPAPASAEAEPLSMYHGPPMRAIDGPLRPLASAERAMAASALADPSAARVPLDAARTAAVIAAQGMPSVGATVPASAMSDADRAELARRQAADEQAGRVARASLEQKAVEAEAVPISLPAAAAAAGAAAGAPAAAWGEAAPVARLSLAGLQFPLVEPLMHWVEESLGPRLQHVLRSESSDDLGAAFYGRYLAQDVTVDHAPPAAGGAALPRAVQRDARATMARAASAHVAGQHIAQAAADAPLDAAVAAAASAGLGAARTVMGAALGQSHASPSSAPTTAGGSAGTPAASGAAADELRATALEASRVASAPSLGSAVPSEAAVAVSAARHEEKEREEKRPEAGAPVPPVAVAAAAAVLRGPAPPIPARRDRKPALLRELAFMRQPPARFAAGHGPEPMTPFTAELKAEPDSVAARAHAMRRRDQSAFRTARLRAAGLHADRDSFQSASFGAITALAGDFIADPARPVCAVTPVTRDCPTPAALTLDQVKESVRVFVHVYNGWATMPGRDTVVRRLLRALDDEFEAVKSKEVDPPTAPAADTTRGSQAYTMLGNAHEVVLDRAMRPDQRYTFETLHKKGLKVASDSKLKPIRQLNTFVFKRHRYLKNAGRNFDHFGNCAVRAYMAGHWVATSLAVLAKEYRVTADRTADGPAPAGGAMSKQELWDTAVLLMEEAYKVEAFAHHYLSDQWAAGHLRTPRAAIHFYMEKIGARAMGVLGGSMVHAALTKLMHDEDNYAGLRVTNRRGDRWAMYGDARFFDGVNAANRQIHMLGIKAAIEEVTQAYDDGVAPASPLSPVVLDYLPRVDSSWQEPDWTCGDGTPYGPVRPGVPAVPLRSPAAKEDRKKLAEIAAYWAEWETQENARVAKNRRRGVIVHTNEAVAAPDHRSCALLRRPEGTRHDHVEGLADEFTDKYARPLPYVAGRPPLVRVLRDGRIAVRGRLHHSRGANSFEFWGRNAYTPVTSSNARTILAAGKEFLPTIAARANEWHLTLTAPGAPHWAAPVPADPAAGNLHSLPIPYAALAGAAAQARADTDEHVRLSIDQFDCSGCRADNTKSNVVAVWSCAKCTKLAPRPAEYHSLLRPNRPPRPAFPPIMVLPAAPRPAAPAAPTSAGSAGGSAGSGAGGSPAVAPGPPAVVAGTPAATPVRPSLAAQLASEPVGVALGGQQ